MLETILVCFFGALVLVAPRVMICLTMSVVLFGIAIILLVVIANL